MLGHDAVGAQPVSATPAAAAAASTLLLTLLLHGLFVGSHA